MKKTIFTLLLIIQACVVYGQKIESDKVDENGIRTITTNVTTDNGNMLDCICIIDTKGAEEPIMSILLYLTSQKTLWGVHRGDKILIKNTDGEVIEGIQLRDNDFHISTSRYSNSYSIILHFGTSIDNIEQLKKGVTKLGIYHHPDYTNPVESKLRKDIEFSVKTTKFIAKAFSLLEQQIGEKPSVDLSEF